MSSLDRGLPTSCSVAGLTAIGGWWLAAWVRVGIDPGSASGTCFRAIDGQVLDLFKAGPGSNISASSSTIAEAVKTLPAVL